MKIHKLYIGKFKIFRQFQLTLEQLTVLAGINGSGKTTLLNLLAALVPLDRWEQLQLPGKEQLLEHPEQFHFSVELKDGRQLEQVPLNELLIELTEAKEEPPLYFPVNYSPDPGKIADYLSYLIFERDVVASRAYQQLREEIEELTSLAGLDLKVSFSRLDRRRGVYFRRGEEEFRLEELSSGEQTIIGKGVELLLAQPYDRLILIDEPENSLHPKWQSRILELYQWIGERFRAQIVVATHSPLVLSSAPPGSLRLLKEEGGVVTATEANGYGWEVGEILQELMGVEYLRSYKIATQFREIYRLIEEGELDGAEELVHRLEGVIGGDDPELNRIKTQLWFERIGR